MTLNVVDRVDSISTMMVQLPLPPVPAPPPVVPSAPSKNPFDDDDDIDDLSPQHPLHSRSSVGSGHRAMQRHRSAPGGSSSSAGASPNEPPAGLCQRCSDCCFKGTARCTRVLLVGPNLLFLVSTLFSCRLRKLWVLLVGIHEVQ